MPSSTQGACLCYSFSNAKRCILRLSGLGEGRFRPRSLVDQCIYWYPLKAEDMSASWLVVFGERSHIAGRGFECVDDFKAVDILLPLCL